MCTRRKSGGFTVNWSCCFIFSSSRLLLFLLKGQRQYFDATAAGMMTRTTLTLGVTARRGESGGCVWLCAAAARCFSILIPPLSTFGFSGRVEAAPSTPVPIGCALLFSASYCTHCVAQTQQTARTHTHTHTSCFYTQTRTLCGTSVRDAAGAQSPPRHPPRSVAALCS